jgi:hypothetical protein
MAWRINLSTKIGDDPIHGSVTVESSAAMERLFEKRPDIRLRALRGTGADFVSERKTQIQDPANARQPSIVK